MTRALPLLLLAAACGGSVTLDTPNPPPEWPLDNVTDVERSGKAKVLATNPAKALEAGEIVIPTEEAEDPALPEPGEAPEEAPAPADAP